MQADASKFCEKIFVFLFNAFWKFPIKISEALIFFYLSRFDEDIK